MAKVKNINKLIQWLEQTYPPVVEYIDEKLAKGEEPNYDRIAYIMGFTVPPTHS